MQHEAGDCPLPLFLSHPAGPCFSSWTTSVILDSRSPSWLNQASQQAQCMFGYCRVLGIHLGHVRRSVTHQSIWDMFWPCSFVPLSYDLSLLHWTLVVLFQFGWKSVQVLTTEWINFSMKGKCTSLTYKVNFRAVHSQIMSIWRGFCVLRLEHVLSSMSVSGENAIFKLQRWI